MKVTIDIRGDVWSEFGKGSEGFRCWLRSVGFVLRVVGSYGCL